MRISCTSIMAILAVASAASAENHRVLACLTSFKPAALEVAPGDTINWEYNSGASHTVTSGAPCSPDGMFYGELTGFGYTFSWDVPLDASGVITYFCEAHCPMGMHGMITVVGGPAVLHVPDDYLTIQEAIDASSDGDTIVIAAGTYYEHSLSIGAEGSPYVTVVGETLSDGLPAVTIDAQQQGRVFTVGQFQDSIVALSNLIITGGGNVEQGGGVVSSGNNTFLNCHLINNTSTMDGGAMSNYGTGGKAQYASPTFIECRFIGNSALDGGAMKNRYCDATLIDCIVSGNTAQDGGEAGGAGGIDNSSSTTALLNSVVCGNWPNQIDSDWQNLGGSCVMEECQDDDGDGLADFCPADCPGNLNGDGVVDGADLTILLGAWGESGGPADIDGSGLVDGADLTVLLGAWGDC